MPTYKSRRSGIDLRTMFRPALTDEAQSALAELRQKQVTTGCTSYIQRKLQIGYVKAARIMDELVETGWLSEPDDTGARHWLRSDRVTDGGQS